MYARNCETCLTRKGPSVEQWGIESETGRQDKTIRGPSIPRRTCFRPFGLLPSCPRALTCRRGCGGAGRRVVRLFARDHRRLLNLGYKVLRSRHFEFTTAGSKMDGCRARVDAIVRARVMVLFVSASPLVALAGEEQLEWSRPEFESPHFRLHEQSPVLVLAPNRAHPCSFQPARSRPTTLVQHHANNDWLPRARWPTRWPIGRGAGHARQGD